MKFSNMVSENNAILDFQLEFEMVCENNFIMLDKVIIHG